MHKSMIAFLVNDHVTAIEGQYEDGGKIETFKTLDPSIKVDDLVVVESGTRHHMTVVKVKAVDVEPDLDSNTEVKWVVQRIDKEGFKDVLAMEAEAIEVAQKAQRRDKKAALKEAMFKGAGDELNALKITHLSDGGEPEGQVTE